MALLAILQTPTVAVEVGLSHILRATAFHERLQTSLSYPSGGSFPLAPRS